MKNPRAWQRMLSGRRLDLLDPTPITKDTIGLAIEAGHPDFWRKYVGRMGMVIGIASFGESAPASALFKHFGFTPENVADTVRAVLGR